MQGGHHQPREGVSDGASATTQSWTTGENQPAVPRGPGDPTLRFLLCSSRYPDGHAPAEARGHAANPPVCGERRVQTTGMDRSIGRKHPAQKLCLLRYSEKSVDGRALLSTAKSQAGSLLCVALSGPGMTTHAKSTDHPAATGVHDKINAETQKSITANSGEHTGCTYHCVTTTV